MFGILKRAALLAAIGVFSMTGVALAGDAQNSSPDVAAAPELHVHYMYYGQGQFVQTSWDTRRMESPYALTGDEHRDVRRDMGRYIELGESYVFLPAMHR